MFVNFLEPGASKLDAGLKKAHKINHSVLHPGNNKQDVSRALAVFHETTSVAIRSYFPSRRDATSSICYAKSSWYATQKSETHRSDALGDAVRAGDGKIEFLRAAADWIEEWCEISDFS